MGDVSAVALPQLAGERLARELQRVGERRQRAVERVGCDVQVDDAQAVAVVVERDAEPPQRPGFVVRQPRVGAEPRREPQVVVTERRDDGPAMVRAAQQPVDNQPGGHSRRGVDVRFETRMLGDRARVVVVDVADARAGREQPLDVVAVAAVGDVEHRHRIARARVDAGEQRVVALDSRHECRRAGARQPQLLQRADAVGVAVEDVVVGHASHPGSSRSPNNCASARLCGA